MYIVSILIDFFSPCSINYLEKGAQILNYDCRSLSLFLVLLVFASRVLNCKCWHGFFHREAHMSGCLSFYDVSSY